MPYLPIDNEEKVSGGQPVGQTGVATGGVGGVGGSGPQGPKTDSSYTNLTNYLQANAGNNANADAVNNKVFQPLSTQTSNNVGEWTQNGEAVKNATQGVTNNQPGATQSLLQQTYGNTWGGSGGKAALDSALGQQGIAQAGHAAQDKRANTPWLDPKGFAAKDNPVAAAPATPAPVEAPASTFAGDKSVFTNPATPQAKASTPGTDANKLNTLHPGAANPYDYKYEPPGGTSSAFQGLYAHGGVIPEGGHYEKLMNKIRGKS